MWNRVLTKNLNSTENEYLNHIIPLTWEGQSAWSREDSIRAFPRINCLIGSRYEGTKSYTLSPRKMDFWPKNKLGPKLAFLAKYWHFWPI